MNISSNTPSRLLAGLGTVALVAAALLFASSRPARTAGGPVPVAVTNAPLATTAADNPALQPVTVTQELSSVDPGVTARGNFYTVPAGKRLVVDYVSSGSGTLDDTNRYSIYVFTSHGGVAQYANFSELPDGSPFSSTSQKVQLFSDAGTTVVVNIAPSGTQPPDVSVTLTGHLVDVP